jgi:hypothetical protein
LKYEEEFLLLSVFARARKQINIVTHPYLKTAQFPIAGHPPEKSG